jgi:hypothetical protein
MLLDILAFMWIQRRTKYFLKNGIPAASSHPLASIIANEAADMINDSNAKNGVTVIFHSKKHGRDVVYDVRWANGQTPQERLLSHAAICPTLRADGLADSSRQTEFLFNENDHVMEGGSDPAANR